MLEKTIAYAKEFTSDPRNKKLIDHEESALRNARRIAKIETAKKLLKLGVARNIVQASTGLNLEELDNLIIS